MKNEYIVVGILLVLAVVIYIFAYTSNSLKRTYEKELEAALKKEESVESEILTQDDIEHLPKPVQDFLIHVGAVGREKVHSFKAVADGEIKMNRDSNWAKIEIEQNNFIGKELIRLFYLRMKVFGVPTYALHSYTDKNASMVGKIAGLFTIINARGNEMRISDTVTLLNDMCLFAPATLIDKRISWEQIDNMTVKATFKTEYATVTATLYFNEKHELINFTSEDRYYTGSDDNYQKVKWSTPFGNYKEINGLLLPSYGEAVWNLPDGDYSYCKFQNIKSIVYNVEQK